MIEHTANTQTDRYTLTVCTCRLYILAVRFTKTLLASDRNYWAAVCRTLQDSAASTRPLLTTLACNKLGQIWTFSNKWENVGVRCGRRQGPPPRGLFVCLLSLSVFDTDISLNISTTTRRQATRLDQQHYYCWLIFIKVLDWLPSRHRNTAWLTLYGKIINNFLISLLASTLKVQNKIFLILILLYQPLLRGFPWFKIFSSFLNSS